MQQMQQMEKLFYDLGPSLYDGPAQSEPSIKYYIFVDIVLIF